MQTIIDSDGVTVWVNSPTGCVGRFGRAGIDIHRAETDLTKGECLFCTHSETTEQDWLIFVAKMKELHGVDVPEYHKPKKFGLWQ